MKLLHPEWEFCFFDDEEVTQFVQKEFPDYGKVFQNFPHNIQRFDFFRYLAVFRLGGFYFDLDVLLGQNLEPLTNEQCVFSFEELTLSRFLRTRYQIDWEIGNYAFGASANHPFLKAIIDNCVRAQTDHAWVEEMSRGIPSFFHDDFLVFNTTGPGLLTRTLAENRGTSQGVTILFPDNVCDESNWHQFGNYGVHLMDGTWRKNQPFLHQKLARLWETRVRTQLKHESSKLGPTRTLCTVDE